MAQPLANAKTSFSLMSNTIVNILSVNVASSWHATFGKDLTPLGWFTY